MRCSHHTHKLILHRSVCVCLCAFPLSDGKNLTTLITEHRDTLSQGVNLPCAGLFPSHAYFTGLQLKSCFMEMSPTFTENDKQRERDGWLDRVARGGDVVMT